MTNRYDLLIQSIHATDTFIASMFGFAVLILIAYRSLTWLPVWMVRPAQVSMQVFILAAFILVTVYFGNCLFWRPVITIGARRPNP